MAQLVDPALEYSTGSNQATEIKVPIKPLTAVSLFTGAGGLDLGLEAVGFSTLYATDIDYHSCQTLRLSKKTASETGRPFFQHAVIPDPIDILELNPADILSSTSRQPGELDLLAGGPPCQAFSVFGRRKGREDPRGTLAFEYLRMLDELRPRAFILENVSGMLTIEGGRLLQDMIEKLSAPAPDLRYSISIFRLNAADYGVPQFRDRVFLIGSREGRRFKDIPKMFADPLIHTASANGLFTDTTLLQPWRTVRDAFRGLPPIGTAIPANHVGRVHSDRIRDRYAALRPGERDHFTRINKLDLDRPSFTIIVGSDKGGGKGHVHPIEPREVTPRESARIQTFPDWVAFSGTSRHPIRQVGNAVPPLLAAAVGNAVRRNLFDLPPVPFEEVVDRLDQGHLFDEDNE